MSFFKLKKEHVYHSYLIDRADTWVEKLTRFILRIRYVFLAMIIAIFAFSAWSVQKIDTNTDEIRFFRPHQPVRKIAEDIEKNLWGLSVVYVIVQSEKSGGVLSKETLKKIRDIQKEVNTYENVSYSLSIADFIDELGPLVDLEDNMNIENILESLSEFDITKGKFSQYLNEKRDMANIRIHLKDSNTLKMDHLIDNLSPHLSQFPEGIKARLAGDITRKRFGEIIVSGQVKSLFMSLISIFVVLTIVFRSVAAGVMVTLPVSVAVLFNFAVMWVFDVTLNPATAVIASIGMGVGVDYSIHYFSRYKKLLTSGLASEHALIQAVKETYQAILANAFAVGTGFLVLTLSAYQIIFDMGWIIALTMGTTAFCALTIVPVLIAVFNPWKSNSNAQTR